MRLHCRLYVHNLRSATGPVNGGWELNGTMKEKCRGLGRLPIIITLSSYTHGQIHNARSQFPAALAQVCLQNEDTAPILS